MIGNDIMLALFMSMRWHRFLSLNNLPPCSKRVQNYRNKWLSWRTVHAPSTSKMLRFLCWRRRLVNC